MARHRRRHRGSRRRRFGDPVISMPSFGNAKEYSPLGKTVKSDDVLIGAGIGLAGGGLVMYGVRRFWAAPPAFVTTYSGPLSALAAGAIAYTLYRKKSRGRAEGYLVGAAAIGVIPTLYAMAKSALPVSVTQYFGDPLIVRSRYGGLLTSVPRPAYAGLLTAVPRPALAGMSPARRAMGY